MKLFLDANILVAVLNKELPLFTYAARVISLNQFNLKYQIYTTPICLAIAYYFAEKKSGSKRAMEKISILAENINIISVGNNQVLKIKQNPKVNDFEDGLQYYAAFHRGLSPDRPPIKSPFHPVWGQVEGINILKKSNEFRFIALFFIKYLKFPYKFIILYVIKIKEHGC
jgi:predicted nucleic acid-binding protein